MRTFEKWKAWVFIGSLVIVASLINSLVSGFQQNRQREVTREVQQHQQKVREEHELAQAAASAQKAAADAGAEHTRFLERHLNKGTNRRPGMQAIGIVASSEDRKLNSTVGDALTVRLKSDGAEIVPSIFRPEFVSDGLLNETFASPSEIFSKLELTNILDVLVLARQEVHYSENPSLENVITANIQLEVSTFLVRAGMKEHTWLFEVNGAGFTQTAARSLAEERLVTAIAKDTKISLPH